MIGPAVVMCRLGGGGRSYAGRVAGPAGQVDDAAPGSIDEVLDRLRARGGRVTTARRLLLTVLFEEPGHHSADQLAAEVQQRAPDVHLSTVYRNLDELERLGVVVHSHLGHGPASYHLASGAHSHFVCSRCGLAFEAPDEVFKGLAREAKRRYRFEIDPHHFAVLGRCAACAFLPEGDATETPVLPAGDESPAP
jgi:Fur family ferric uptake transcriptional regulator